MANQVYNSFKRDIMGGSISLSSDTVFVALLSSSYSVDIDGHQTFNDITGEISGTGYTTSGQELTGKTVDWDIVDDEGVFDAGDVVWSSSTITARAAVLYKKGDAPSKSPLICYVDFGSDKSSSAGDFTIQWNSEGILNLN